MGAGAVKQNAPKSLMLAVCRDARPLLGEAGRHVDMIGRAPSLLGGGRAQLVVFPLGVRTVVLPASSRETALATDSTQSAPHLECQTADLNYQLSTAINDVEIQYFVRVLARLPLLASHAASSRRTTHAVGATGVPSLPLAG